MTPPPPPLPQTLGTLRDELLDRRWTMSMSGFAMKLHQFESEVRRVAFEEAARLARQAKECAK